MCRGRQENLAKARALMDSGNSTAANDCYQKAVDISPLTAKHFIEASCCNSKSAYDRSILSMRDACTAVFWHVRSSQLRLLPGQQCLAMAVSCLTGQVWDAGPEGRKGGLYCGAL